MAEFRPDLGLIPDWAKLRGKQPLAERLGLRTAPRPEIPAAGNIAFTYAKAAPNIEEIDFSQQVYATMVKPVNAYVRGNATREAFSRAFFGNGAPAEGRGRASVAPDGDGLIVSMTPPKVVAFDYLATYRKGSHNLRDLVRAEKLKVHPNAGKFTDAESEHLWDIGAKIETRRLRDDDPYLRDVGPLQTYGRIREEKEFIRAKNLEAFVRERLETDVREVAGLLVTVSRPETLELSGRSVTLNRSGIEPHCSSEELERFFARKYGVKLAPSERGLPLADRFGALTAKIPFGAEIHRLAIQFKEEQIEARALGANGSRHTLDREIHLEDGSRIRRMGQDGDGYILEGMRGQDGVRLHAVPATDGAYGLRLFLGDAEVDLGRDMHESMGILKRYYNAHTLRTAFGDGGGLGREGYARIHGRVKSDQALREGVDKVIKRPYQEAFNESLEAMGATVIKGTGHSHNPYSYGKNFGQNARQREMEAVFDAAMDLRVFAGGHCGFIQNQIVSEGGHIGAFQDVAAAAAAPHDRDPRTFVPGLQHGSDAYEKPKKPSLSENEPFTATAGLYDRPIGSQPVSERARRNPLFAVAGMDPASDGKQVRFRVVPKSTMNTWKPVAYTQLNLPYLVRDGEAVAIRNQPVLDGYGEAITVSDRLKLRQILDRDGNDLLEGGRKGKGAARKPVPGETYDQWLVARMGDLDPRTDPRVHSLVFVHDGAKPMRDEEGQLILDNGRPVYMREKVTVRPTPAGPQVVAIERWGKVAKRDGNGLFLVTHPGPDGQVVHTYEKLVQGLPGTPPADPKRLVDKILTPNDCIHSQHGLNLPQEGKITGGRSAITANSVSAHTAADPALARDFVTAGVKGDMVPHPVHGLEGMGVQQSVVEAKEAGKVGGAFTIQATQYHLDMMASDRHNVYHQGVFTDRLPDSDLGRHTGVERMFQGGDHVKAARDLRGELSHGLSPWDLDRSTAAFPLQPPAPRESDFRNGPAEPIALRGPAPFEPLHPETRAALRPQADGSSGIAPSEAALGGSDTAARIRRKPVPTQAFRIRRKPVPAPDADRADSLAFAPIPLREYGRFRKFFRKNQDGKTFVPGGVAAPVSFPAFTGLGGAPEALHPVGLAASAGATLGGGIVLTAVGAQMSKEAVYGWKRGNAIRKALAEEHAATGAALRAVVAELAATPAYRADKLAALRRTMDHLVAQQSGLAARHAVAGKEKSDRLFQGVVSAAPLASGPAGVAAAGIRIAEGASHAAPALDTAAAALGGVTGGLTGVWGFANTGRHLHELRRLREITPQAIQEIFPGIDQTGRMAVTENVRREKQYRKFAAANNAAYGSGGVMMAASLGAGPAAPVVFGIGAGISALATVGNFVAPRMTWRGGVGDRNPMDTHNVSGSFVGADVSRRANRLLINLNNQGSLVNAASTEVRESADGISRFAAPARGQERYAFKHARLAKYFIPNAESRRMRKLLERKAGDPVARSYLLDGMSHVADHQLDWLTFKQAELRKEVSQLRADRALYGPLPELDAPYRKKADELRACDREVDDMVALRGRLRDFGAFSTKELLPDTGAHAWDQGAFPAGTRSDWAQLRLEFINRMGLDVDSLTRKEVKALEKQRTEHTRGIRPAPEFPGPQAWLEDETIRSWRRTNVDKLMARVWSETLPSRIAYERQATVNIVKERIWANRKAAG